MRAASRKWQRRGRRFVVLAGGGQPEKAVAYGERFRRQDRLTRAIAAARAELAGGGR